MTEEEARKRWCPFARAHWSGQAGQDVYQGNRFFAEDGKTSDPSTGCIASDCMAWRWHINRPGAPVNDPPLPSDSEGYCGLAR